MGRLVRHLMTEITSSRAAFGRDEASCSYIIEPPKRYPSPKSRFCEAACSTGFGPRSDSSTWGNRDHRGHRRELRIIRFTIREPQRQRIMIVGDQ